MVVTACDEKYAELQSVTSPTIKEYCDLHGYECQISRFTETARPPAWHKIPIILSAFKSGVDFVLWIDTDAIVVNKSFKLESIIEEDKDMYFSCNWGAMNSGVFLVRNCQRVKDFLNLTWDQTQFMYDGWWEQKAMIHLLETNCYDTSTIKEIPAIEFNSEEYWTGCFVYHMPQMSNSERIKRVLKIKAKS